MLNKTSILHVVDDMKNFAIVIHVRYILDYTNMIPVGCNMLNFAYIVCLMFVELLVTITMSDIIC